MASTPTRTSQRVKDTFRLKYQWVVTVDLNSSIDERPKVGKFQLIDKKLFPDGNPLIDSVDERQKWKRGQTITLLWPTKDSRGKTSYLITRTQVHGLYADSESARFAEQALVKAYDDESQKRRNALEMNDDNRRNGLFSEDDESTHSSPHGKDGDIEENVVSPSPKRHASEAHMAALKKINTKRQLFDTAKSDTAVLAYLKQIAKDVNEMKTEFAALKKNTQDSNRDTNEKIDRMERNLKSISKKQESANKKASDISRQISGKVVPLPGRLATDDDVIFNPATEPLIYMTVDRTEEINDLYKATGGNEKNFVKSIGKLFYGDDLWFWLLGSETEGRRKTDRKPLRVRDPEGVKMIERIFRRYWECNVCTRDEEFIRKMNDLDSAKEKNNELAMTSMQADIKCLRKRKYDQWYAAAILWFKSHFLVQSRKEVPTFF